MKLTLAMGLQFDNNKAANMYALSIGQGRQVAELRPSEPVIDLAFRADQAMAVIPQATGTAFFLTYNLNGLPDTLMFDGELDVFA